MYRPKSNGGGEFVYELTDHLGNVRATLSNETTVYIATMEDNGAADYTNPRVTEMQYFANQFETQQVDARMNHTLASTAVPAPPYEAVPNPANTSYLHWASGVSPQNVIGAGITMKVETGDQVNLEAWAKFQHNATYTRDATPALMASLASGAFLGLNGLETTLQATQDFTTGIPLMLAGTNSDPATKPYAYLNYIVFDQNFVFKDGGATRVPDAAGFDAGMEISVLPQLVNFAQPIMIGQSGFIYVWVSNESANTQVWWDDLKVTLTGSRVTQATDYYAFGSTMRSQAVPTEPEYRFGMQGAFSEKDDETGWNNFEARNFDPIISRWLIPDRAREFWSPYLGMGNDPIRFIDPDGETIKINGYTYIPGVEYTGKNVFIAATVKSLNRLYQAEQAMGGSIIKELSDSDIELKILKTSSLDLEYKNENRTLGFNPNAGLYTFDGPTSSGKKTGAQSAEIGLIHDVGNPFYYKINGTLEKHFDEKPTLPDYKNLAEQIAVGIETQYLLQINRMFNLNNTIRNNDYGDAFKTISPESTSPQNTLGDRD